MLFADRTGAQVYHFDESDAAYLPWTPEEQASPLFSPAQENTLPVRFTPARPPAGVNVMSTGDGRLEPNVHKIAVLGSASISDFLSTLPALHALRMAYPGAEITLLGFPWQAEFLHGRPGPIDRVQVLSSAGVDGDNEGDGIPLEAADRLVGEHFDLAIQLRAGDAGDASFLQHLGARLTVGFLSPQAPFPDRWTPYSIYQVDVMRYLEVVSLLGVELVSIDVKIPLLERDLEESVRFVPENSEPFIVMHLGAKDPRRRWPVEKFAGVADALTWAGARVVLVGSEAERELTQPLARRAAFEVLDLAGQLSLGGLAGLLSRASVVIANDSGPLHLARTVGAPTVGIYWCANLMTSGPLTRIQHRPAISWRLHCPVCGLHVTRSNCGHLVSFVDEVTKEEVTASALELAGLGWNGKAAGNYRLTLEG